MIRKFHGTEEGYIPNGFIKGFPKIIGAFFIIILLCIVLYIFN